MGKYCGKCGNPIERCTCSGRIPPGEISYIDGIALEEGEQKVKEYALGKYPFGCGTVSLVITNKRVILKESYSFLFLSHNSVEELNLESVHGVNGAMGRGMNRILFLIGLIITLASPISLLSMARSFSRGSGVGAVFTLILGIVIMILSCIFPYMTFGIIGKGSDHQSLMTGINVIGKSFLNRGVIFQPRPTRDAEKSIKQAGACIFDLRTYGDEAILKWKRS